MIKYCRTCTFVPTANCVESSYACREHLMETHGFETWPINTSVGVGELVRLEFAFYTDIVGGEEIRSMYAARIIKIRPACPRDEYRCSGVCPPLPCSTSQDLLEIHTPVLTVVGPSARSMLPYGIPINTLLVPCLSMKGISSCCAVAPDTEDGDISQYVSVEMSHNVFRMMLPIVDHSHHHEFSMAFVHLEPAYSNTRW